MVCIRIMTCCTVVSKNESNLYELIRLGLQNIMLYEKRRQWKFLLGVIFYEQGKVWKCLEISVKANRKQFLGVRTRCQENREVRLTFIAFSLSWPVFNFFYLCMNLLVFKIRRFKYRIRIKIIISNGKCMPYSFKVTF